MIYIFGCCKEGCGLPARLCAACERCLKEGPCAECCGALTDCFQDFFNRPLGGFVFMAFWIGALEMGLCMYMLIDWDILKDCHFRDASNGGEQVGMFNWLMVQAGFASLNLLFAPYVQWQLWRRLNEEAREPDDTTDGESVMDARTRMANTPYGEVAASKHDIKEAFKEVFLYDCGVLLYVLALIASFVWSRLGYTWIDGSDATLCNPDYGLPEYASLVGMFFPIFVVFYGCAWYCTMSWMDDNTTLILRHGAAAAATVAAAAGRPIPGYGGQPGGGGYPVRGGGRQSGGYGKLQAVTSMVQGRGGGSMRSGHEAADPRYMDSNSSDYSNNNRPKKPSSVKSFAKLLACLGLDFMGNASYFLPAAGEVTDVVFAPASAVMLKMMFNANAIAMLGLAEELAPYTDVVPTATIAWFLETCLPNHPITKCVGIDSEWAMVGSNSGRY